MKKYKYWLHSLPEVGDATIRKLIGRFGDAKGVYEACLSDEPAFRGIIGLLRLDDERIANVIKTAKATDPKKEYEIMLSKGIRFITEDDPEYPVRLRSVKTHPYAIYVNGSLPPEDVPAVSVIGSRYCSEYGKILADAFGNCLGQSGISVVSGMAVGVDGLSQHGALDGGGMTYAVLGSGVDICYPVQNRSLYESIPAHGGIISALPPGSPPERKNFPMRNSVVAALCDVLLVVEARQKSGTSITVNLALSMNKDIYAVPGRITDRLSDGCNMLIRQGAGVALSPEDFVSEVNMLWARRGDAGKADAVESTPLIGTKDMIADSGIASETAACSKAGSISKVNKKSLSGILRYVDVNPVSAEDIHQRRLKHEPDALLSDTLSQLALKCIKGELIQVASGYFYRPV